MPKSALIAFVVLYIVSTAASFAAFSKRGGDSGAPLSGNLGAEGGLTIDPSEPKTESCPLNGMLFTKTEKNIWEKRRPLAIMVENSPEARPHSGLIKADVIYEAVSEGGVTRFMPVYLCAAAAADVIVAPVRSVRSYFIDWASEYADPLFGHVGGANCSADKYPDGGSGPCKTDKRAQAIERLSDIGWRYSNGNDLDQFSVGAKAYIRNETRLGTAVATEHSVEGSTEKLWKEGVKRGWTNKDPEGKEWLDGFNAWEFKQEAEAGSRGQVAAISHDFWEGYKLFDARWTYDAATNSYLRFTGGEPHKDLETGSQLSAKNVVVQKTKELTSIDELKHNYYEAVGEGEALIFQDGNVIDGYWEKKSRTDRTIFTTKKGEEIKFNPGMIWISIVATNTNVAY